MLEKAREILDDLNGDMYYPLLEELNELAEKDGGETFIFNQTLVYDSPGCDVYALSLAFISKEGKPVLETAISYSI